MTRPASLALLVLAIWCQTARAIWPFKQKRFVAEAFIDAGPLGLDEMEGRVVAVGDWNGDQQSDLFVLSKDERSVQVYLWSRDNFMYTASHSLTLSSKIVNVVPGDYNHDGRLDLLVMSEQKEDGGWWGSGKQHLGMQVFLGGGEEGGFQLAAWELAASTTGQPIVFDANGSLRPSLLGYHDEKEATTRTLITWFNTGSGFTSSPPPLKNPDQACGLYAPHSSALIDIDGDCLPDLVLHCTQPHQAHHSIQIWLNRGADGFVLARSYDLPRGSGPLSFADMNRDGSIDIIFPVCSGHSTSTGLGSECSINIAYNKQVPICSTEGSQLGKDGALQCRGYLELCTPDEGFDFSFDTSSGALLSVPLEDLLPRASGDADLLLHPPKMSHIPLPIRPGDFDVDGFPDLLITIANSTAAPPSGGPFGSSRHAGHQVKILRNVPCGKNVAGCDSKQKGGRGLKLGGGKGWDALDSIWDATGGSWIDLDDDGSLDIVVQRSGEQEQGRVAFVQNNFYHDAFFLKAQVLNGACQGDCEPAQGGKKYKPLGVSYSGATYKFTVQDTLGRRVAQQVSQLPQTGFHALGTPYAFFGLGRTNNYVERLTVGSTLHPLGHTTILESLIPNSQILINPPFPISVSQDPAPMPVKQRSKEWQSELFLHPGDWIPWVGAAVVGTVVLLGMVVVGLNEKEKREDEKERRRALHAINFQAL